jgi:hypothetical protein
MPRHRTVDPWPYPGVVHVRHRSSVSLVGPLILAGMVIAGAYAYGQHRIKPAARPVTPAPVRTVTQTITRTVIVHAGHPALSGVDTVLIIAAICAAIVACVAIAGKRWGR